MRQLAKQLILAGIACAAANAQPFSPHDEAFRRASHEWRWVIPSGGTNVTLGWNSPYPGDTVTLTNFNVYCGAASGVYTNATAAGTNLTMTLTLPAPGLYYFAATDMDTNGLESAYSSEIVYQANP